MEDAPRLRNRELSWLDFNERVLTLAGDSRVPLLERARYLAIFSTNLDEFFQVRVAGLKDQVAAGVTATSPDGLSASSQLRAIRERADGLVARHNRIFLDEVAPALADEGVRLSRWEDLDDDDEKFLVQTFNDRIFPVLTPLAVDPGHPFPYISDLSLNLGVLVSDPDSGDRRFARVKVPSLLPRFVVLPDGERFVPLESVIAAHLAELFPGMVLEQQHVFRVTRNADLILEEEEADDLLAAVELELRRRRFGRAVRLDIDAAMTQQMRAMLQRELALGDEDVYVHEGPLDLGGLESLRKLDRPDLLFPRYQPVTPGWVPDGDGGRAEERGQRGDLFAALSARDLLVHHPYESFGSTVEELVLQASADPAVQAIKMTLYRTSGESEIVRALIRAAELGKQVAVIIELKARFDESANIEWARVMEKAGVHVIYGIIGLKVHAKTLLIVREEDDVLRPYVHLGTGNYNWQTAATYEDLGLLTSDPEIGGDLTQLFNELTGFGRNVRYDALLVAPHTLRQGIVDLIRGEVAVAAAGGEGRLIMKMNSLGDPDMVEELYAASEAGVEVDLLVRGVCCLVPGVPGQSENIRVRSVVGRYLEHSRIYYFANGDGVGVPRYLIGSADLMARNLDQRVEALATVSDPALQGRLDEVLATHLADNMSAWELDAEGRWHRLRPEDDDLVSFDDLVAGEAGEAAETEVLRGVDGGRVDGGVIAVDAQARLQELAVARSRRSG